MATRIDPANVRTHFPGAFEALENELLEFSTAEEAKPLLEAEQFFVHNDRLYSRTMEHYGFHYAVWAFGEWRCPPTGETKCPWQ